MLVGWRGDDGISRVWLVVMAVVVVAVVVVVVGEVVVGEVEGVGSRCPCLGE